MQSLFKNLAFAFSFALLVWLGYIVFFKEDSAVVNEEATSQAIVEGKEFLSKLQELRELKLDDSLFSDPRFRSLTDHRQTLLDEPYGRENPFEPTPAVEALRVNSAEAAKK